MAEDTIQVVIQGNVLGNPEFVDELIAMLKEEFTDRDVIIDRRKNAKPLTFSASEFRMDSIHETQWKALHQRDESVTKIAVDPFKDLGPRRL